MIILHEKILLLDCRFSIQFPNPSLCLPSEIMFPTILLTLEAALGTTFTSSVVTVITAAASSGGRGTGAMVDQVITLPQPALLMPGVAGTFLAILCPVFTMVKLSSSLPVLSWKVKVAMTPLLFAASWLSKPPLPQVVPPSHPSTVMDL